MSRKPLIDGNWKMNLNHFEAIALVQKIAFSLPDKYFDKVDVAGIPPFTDLRSVQTLVDSAQLRLASGAPRPAPGRRRQAAAHLRRPRRVAARVRRIHRRDQWGISGQAGLPLRRGRS